ncbi:MAG: L-threonine 3-dehydrogenase [Bacilli bacterium]|jgi:threonine 3-dehydrogenase|nr:L-threonine 3-dehydrogenase [Bacillota bacterium]NLM31591.1 L-threonine 3-dehydrogenase [Acholeplasmataceae bacterium]HOA78963.1 L-threonine 3-dehydrogenase [Bacilli bacterium]HQC89944.1 L-threonine 3-dehydrogenase [Bacilli bacterium]
MTETLSMKAVVKERPQKGFSYLEKTISTDLAPDEVLVKVISASFCGTDYHIYQYDEWARKRINLPLIVGHELSGEIIKVGAEVKEVKVGDWISAETHIFCSECEYCLRDEKHICEKTKIIGVDTDGCFANYVKLPAANCFVSSKNVDPRLLSIQEPLGNAVHTITHFPITGKTVAVVGCGPIGLMAIDVAKAMNAAKVIAIETKEYRLRLAEKIGADAVINPMMEDVVLSVLTETGGRGVDVVGEFSGNKNAIESAFKYLKPGGAISMLGIPNRIIEVDFASDIVFKGVSIYGVVGRRIYQTWNQVKELLDKNLLHLEKIITHTFPLSEINRAAEVMGSGNCGKILLLPEEV